MDFTAFYGCLIPNRYPGIEASIRKVMPLLDVNIHDLPEFSCCPAPGVFQSFDYDTWLALAARNIAVAEAAGRDVLTFCNGCFGSLSEANKVIQEDELKREKVNRALAKVGMEVKGTINVKHIAILLYKDVGLDAIAQKVTRPLNLRVATHSGCHLLRSDEYREIDDSERPIVFDKLVQAIGCDPVEYNAKTQCCGAGGGVRSAVLDVSLQVLHNKLRVLGEIPDVDCITDLCPFCHLQLDRGQVELQRTYGLEYATPVLYYLQLLGMAMGLSPDELGVTLNFTPVEPLLKKLNITVGAPDIGI